MGLVLPGLTPRQKDIYDFLLRSIREKGYAPSILEIGAKFKIASTNGVSDHLKSLEKKGYIRRVGKRYKKNGVITLKAANEKYPPITVSEESSESQEK